MVRAGHWWCPHCVGWGTASGLADPLMGTPGPWVESALLCGWGAPFLHSKVRMGEALFPWKLTQPCRLCTLGKLGRVRGLS